MVFTTYKFFIFIIILLAAYYGLPSRVQWPLLLIGSYVFYAFASPIYLLFLIFTTLVTYYGGIGISKSEKRSKAWVISTVTILLLMLAVFKYATFILDNVGWLLGVFGARVDMPVLNILLPVGLSFYMFQSMGYVIDVYRGMYEPEQNVFKYALFVGYFPQIMEGPIGDYAVLAPQLVAEHKFEYKQVVYGLQRAAWGFFKKLVIANQISLIIGNFWTEYYNYEGYTLFFGIILYSIELYADFSGYMDIAIGCSQMFGITIDENFNTPYLSRSVPEYWRRWHMTLGRWFKNYLFYPLLRAKWCRKFMKKYRKTNPYLANLVPNAFALIIVWTLMGLWHGADWSYVLFDVYYGIIMILSVALAPLYDRFHKSCPRFVETGFWHGFQTVRTYLLVLVGYSMFAPANLSVTVGIWNRVLLARSLGQFMSFGYSYLREFIGIFLGVVVLICVDVWHYRHENEEVKLRDRVAALPAWKRNAIYVISLVVIIVMGAYGTADLNQFAYFKF